MTDIEELKRKYAATTKDWNAQRYGVVVGGPVVDYANGSGQSQIAMFSGAEHIHMDERDANAAFTTAIHNAFPAIVAKLEAAQRLKDTVETWLLLDNTVDIGAALAAFDKEQQ